MATGVIKLDSIAEVFEQAAKFSPPGSTGLSSTNSDRSLSEDSSVTSSPTSSTSPVHNFSTSVPARFRGPISYSNPVFELDPTEFIR
ncbi:hypothetical protein GCK32_015628 [Trichostrongylus colubriformis]|uniref:Uncharacterized protein n=1 Tax=Trichostrongylus colubriformis TaxID=6319 RepID=A0AAN8IFY3_TRICO